MIRIAEPSFGPHVEALVLEVLRSGRLAQGPMVERFEALCAEMSGASHAIAVSNGTVTLELILEALGIGPGDEVVTTPFTFAATLNAVVRAGARVRFADIGDDFTIDPDAVASIAGPATVAILPVHLYGLPADMPTLTSLARSRGWAVIEDAAQAHGATVAGRPAGGWGIGSFSFYATKNVTSGEGGCITTSDPELASSLRLLRNQGMAARYEYEVVGTNARMTELQAAVAIPQLERLEALNDRRRANAAALTANLKGIEGLTLPSVSEGRSHVWHQYTVLLPPGTDRAESVRRLAASGIEAGIYYPALVWDHPPYRTNPLIDRGDTPIAADASRRCLSLPVHPALSEADVERIAQSLRDALG